MNCPICSGESAFALTKDGCEYLRCRECEFLFHRSGLSQTIQAALPSYDDVYWEMERQEALRRERDDCFARALELVYLSTIPVRKVLDFGCGQGETVRLLRQNLGLETIGVDPFGEFAETDCLHRKNLEELRQVYPRESVDAIYSIEVFEHLENPKQTLSDLLYFLKPGGKILVNTGTQEYIAECDPDQGYIDPLRRGHISIYSLKAFTALAGFFDLKASFLAGRNYEVILSRASELGRPPPLAENLELFRRMGEWFPTLFGEYMRLLFVEGALQEQLKERTNWALMLQEQAQERTNWALTLDGELKEKGEYIKNLHEEFEGRTRWVVELQRVVGEQKAEIERLEREARGPFSWRNQSELIKQIWRKLKNSS